MATKHPPVAHPQLHAPQPKKKIAFDINKPIKTGYFMKQGEKHRKFKRRFFVLYHNFLVYYNEDTTWKFDCTKGDSPSSRRGAVKLKGARAAAVKPDQVPSDCHFGFVLHAPDITNSRKTYLMDTSSVSETAAWMEAINGAVPSESK